jgi:RNA polymerase sigma-70 factor, ECF subfamily
MAFTWGDRVDLPAAGPGASRARERAASETSEDATLVIAARDGDRAAFGRLYDRYARMVHGVLLAKIPLAEVDDLVQDVFMTALRRLSTLRDIESFGAWLAAIARNRAIDYHRRSSPEDQFAEDTPDEDIGSGNNSGDHEGSAAAILDVVRSLPAAYRETLILRLVEGMTGPEIAARTGMTHGSVRVNLHRGMQQLRAKLCPNPGSNGPDRRSGNHGHGKKTNGKRNPGEERRLFVGWIWRTRC